jgi:UDP-N-acetylglucosamine--N-acetylmuramyl-(pentapeptide) pyrophosphoryl-undecaprenol N-acetylglucosamine transferase
MRVLMAAGGTGGHLIPAVRIAEAIHDREASIQFLFMGGDRGFEEQVITARGERYKGLPARGFERRRIWRNFGTVIANMRASRMARTSVREFDPHAAVGCGGYASYFPIRAARELSVPYVLQEQNRIPGLATKWLAARAHRTFIAYKQTHKELSGCDNVELVGNPVDPRLASMDRTTARQRWNLSNDETVILVTGGSGGARSINGNIARGLQQPAESGPVTVLWQTGRNKAEWDGKPASGWRVEEFEFTDAMTEAFVASDLIVARSGALTVSEIAAAGRPAILVPFPRATADHQTHNARVLTEAGGAILVTDQELNGLSLLERVCSLLKDREQLRAMGAKNRALGRPDAAGRIADCVISLLQGT